MILSFGRKTFVFLMVCGGYLSSSWAQTTIHVPADQPTIQAGIDAAQNGDTVLVSPGTYIEAIDFKGKAITVTSGATSSVGAQNTIIQAPSLGPTVSFQSGETSASTINGFTITHVAAPFDFLNQPADGVAVGNASATITNSIVTANNGCGISATGATNLLIQGNLITFQKTPNRCGTAAYPVLISGGAIAVTSSSNVQVLDNNVNNNYGPYPGVYITLITNLMFKDNTVKENSGIGPAVYMTYVSNTIFVQNLVFGNTTAALDGPSGEETGGVRAFSLPYFDIHSSVITNNTVYGNYSTDINTPGATSEFLLSGTFDSSVVENNLFIATGQDVAAVCGVVPSASAQSPPTFSHNDVYGANQPLYIGHCGTTGQAVGNLSADPLFIDPSTGNLHTSPQSPIVAAGDINAPDIPPADLDGKARTVCGTIDMGVFEVRPNPPIMVTSSANPSVGGSSVTFTATVQGNCNIPTGTVTFMDGSTPLATVTLNPGASAVFTASLLTVGNHNITVTYPGDFNFDSSTSNILVQVVTGYPTVTNLQVSPNPADAFQSITFSASVSSQFGTPMGTVNFFAGSAQIGTGNLNANGLTSVTNSTLSAGTYSITAVYSASLLFASSSSAPATEVVNGVPTLTALTSNLNPSLFGQTVMFTAAVTAPLSSAIPTGTVTLQEGAMVLGSTTLSTAGVANFSLSTLTVGSHNLSAYYGGSPNDNTSTSSVVAQVVAPAVTSVSLSISPNPANVGQSVTFSATVSSSIAGLATPGGTVTFADQYGSLGTIALAGGQATLTTSTLAAGTHAVSASFTNGGNFANSVSPSIIEVIQNHDFTIALSPTTLTLSAGQSSQINIILSSIGSFSDTLTLSAALAPTYSTLSFGSSTVSLMPGGSSSSVLSVRTAALPPGVASHPPEQRPGGTPSPIVLTTLAVLPVLFSKRRRLALLSTILVVPLLLSSSGCGNIVYTMNTVAPGTYVIPITATDSLTQVTHTMDLTLVVTR
jgi:hypothetical protein